MEMSWKIVVINPKGNNRTVKILPRVSNCPPEIINDKVSLSLDSYGSCMTPLKDLPSHDHHVISTNEERSIKYANRIMDDIQKIAENKKISITINRESTLKAIKEAFLYDIVKVEEKKLEVKEVDPDELSEEEIEALSPHEEESEEIEEPFEFEFEEVDFENGDMM